MMVSRLLLCFALASAPATLMYAAGPVATTTSLAASVNGKTVKKTAHGNAVTLTAQVEGPSAPLTQGQVQFCDAAASRCEDLALLGTAQLTAAGVATLKIVPGIGDRSFRAQFLGVAGQYSASNSSPATVNVTGTFPSTTTLTTTGSNGTYTFTATAMTTGSAVEPTGMAAFFDLSQGVSNGPFAQVPFGSATPGLTLKAGQFIDNLNLASQQPAFADFNGDGITDFVLSQGYNEQVFLGKANGTYTARATLGQTTHPGQLYVTADFNQDGIADVATTYPGASTVSVFLGKGDGTFQAPLTAAVNSAIQIQTADFNHDGIPDLIVSGSGGTVLLLGNGDGTFSSKTVSNVGGFSAVLDANGDGNPDLLTEPNTGSLAVYLNDGKGNFSLSPATQTGNQYDALTVGDFNNDGIPDVATADPTGYSVLVLLGKGNGTFAPQTAMPVQGQPTALAVTDLNRDGNLDLAVGLQTQYESPAYVGVLLGLGNGNFNASAIYPYSKVAPIEGPAAIFRVDANVDGNPDLLIGDSGFNVVLDEPTEVVQATSPATTFSAGSHQIEATSSFNQTYGPSTSSSVTVQGPQ